MSKSRSPVESDDKPAGIDQPSSLSLPEDFTLSTSWRRAQEETDHGGPITDAERMVSLEDGGYHRVTFALRGRTLLAECDCRGFGFRGFCAHVASLWWQWCRGDIVVQHLDTGREYTTPPGWLRLDDPHGRTAYDDLTAAELDAFLSCDIARVGVREYARFTDRSPGTVGNLLARAREKLQGGDRR